MLVDKAKNALVPAYLKHTSNSTLYHVMSELLAELDSTLKAQRRHALRFFSVLAPR